MAEFLKGNWGNLASVLGLGISLCVLWIAKKARDAAEEARLFARIKSLVEELEDANHKTQRAGVYLRDQKWEIAQLLTDEILGACRASLARWGDQLRDSKNNLLRACTVLSSVGESCRSAATAPLAEDAWRQTMAAQLEALQLVGSTLGEVRRAEERSKDANA